MKIRPEAPPREFDVPCVYRQTSVRRSATLIHDPYVIVSFASTAASYALDAYDSQEDISDYVKQEFTRHYGGSIEVESIFDFQGNHVALDIIVGVNLPYSYTLEVQ